jgi:type I restriction enzyme S subunit
MKEENLCLCEVSLGDVVFENVSQQGPSANDDFVYVDIGSIDRESKAIVEPKLTAIGKIPSRAKQNLRAGDVLISMTRPNLNAVALVPIQLDGAIGSTGFHVLRSKWVSSKFLYYLVQTDAFINEMSSVVQGALYPAVRPKDISSFKFLLPSTFQQSRIVEKLEELLSDLDAGVAELIAAQKKLGQYRQSLLKAAVEGALTAEWRKTNQPEETGSQLLEHILKQRRAHWEAKQLAKFQQQGKTPPKGWQDKYPEPVKPDTRDLPEGWVWASVDHLLSEIETGKSFKCEERPPQGCEVGIVKVSAVSWGEYNEQESKTCHDESMIRNDLFVKPGNFLFSRANTIELVGACVIAKSVTKRIMLSDKILRFLLVRDELAVWLLTLLRSELGRYHIERLSSGNQESMRNIGQERIKQIPVPLPPMSEIQHATQLLDETIEAAKSQEIAIAAALKQSAAQRKNILNAAFSGQLVPQDPNDEPASVLLERIRNERQHAKIPAKRSSRKAGEEISP